MMAIDCLHAFASILWPIRALADEIDIESPFVCSFKGFFFYFSFNFFLGYGISTSKIRYCI